MFILEIMCIFIDDIDLNQKKNEEKNINRLPIQNYEYFAEVFNSMCQSK